MRDSEPSRISLITTYFAFTSLSTVGFGDFHPRSNAERMFCAMILLFGVAIFSMIMGDFIDILHSFQFLNQTLDDGDNLMKFFGTMKKFNGDNDMKQDLRKKIESHFDFKWEHDKN
jgi:hypothetical protein